MHAPSSERPLPLKLPRESKSTFDRERSRVADAAAAASVAASGLCRSSLRGREQQLRSRAWPTLLRRRASHPTGRSAVHAPSSERPVPLKLPRESKSSIDRERSRRCCGGERHTRQGDQRCTRRAASGLCRSSLRKRARATLIESVADAAAAASVTPDRAISGAAPISERPVPLKLPRESKSSIDRERSRRSRGGERHTRQGDQRRSARRAASCLCRSSFRKRAGALLIKSDKDTAVAASVTPDRAISGARAEQRADCAAQASEREPEQH